MASPTVGFHLSGFDLAAKSNIDDKAALNDSRCEEPKDEFGRFERLLLRDLDRLPERPLLRDLVRRPERPLLRDLVRRLEFTDLCGL